MENNLLEYIKDQLLEIECELNKLEDNKDNLPDDVIQSGKRGGFRKRRAILRMAFKLNMLVQLCEYDEDYSEIIFDIFMDDYLGELKNFQ